MSFLSSLTKTQKEAMGLLQVGTFLEYFDLMLYVHMAVLLNDLFFPKTDPKTASLLTAFAFCSTYLLRPFGALFFGYIGDHFGRKATVIMTTMIMAISCIIMATLPTYAQIGISAAWFVTICRMAQGLSSMGEVIGAEIYMTEITKPPARYPAVGLIGLASRVGTVSALGVAMLVTTQGFDWRNGFWIGAAIAVVGSVARTRLRETPEFIDMKRHLKRAFDDVKGHDPEKTKKLLAIEETLKCQKVDSKTIFAYFAVTSGAAVNFYFIYFFCGGILKEMGLTPNDIIYQNFIVSIFELISIGVIVFLGYYIYPLKILKFKALLYLPVIIIFSFLLSHSPTRETIFFIQSIGMIVGLAGSGADAIMFSHFPVFKRFRYVSFIYAISRSIMAVVTSFGLVYLIDFLGPWGLCIVLVPITLSFLWGLYHYEKLEHKIEGSFLRSFFRLRAPSSRTVLEKFQEKNVPEIYKKVQEN
ncbi:MAG: MFS transporter [Alphaproteobacteria bacterium 16-39-46]|nr:MAG: MFS transporter [Alphaproteobacteria bacterium 16-39-46]OZA43133.1 MAG: MFS transporter [Alphaproteobacteria bacterium 17-39-52]HQS84033.1 MFS transporter [Alphaproteobacteria bacterium]HQS93624.1 MFS transporter [Alphaproteobacteria bacterium]